MLSGLQKAASSVRSAGAPCPLELLAHYEIADPETGDSRSGFAVILELTKRNLVVEGDVAFTAGDELSLRFFLPDPGADSGRVNVSLRCVVSACQDESRLHYGMRISKIGNAAKRAIGTFDPGASGDPQ